MVHHLSGAEIITLVPAASLVIGRAPGIDVCIPEPTLSRHHARVEVLGSEIWLEDLGSSNGSFVNGNPATRCKLYPGDHVSLGNMVSLSIHTAAAYTQGMEQHDRFLLHLTEELVRSRTFHRPLSMVMVRCAPGADLQRFHDWCPRIKQLLRPVDRIAIHSPGIAELLLPEADEAAALQQAGLIVAAGPSVRCGIAVDEGSDLTAEELIDRGLTALERATNEGPIVAQAHRGGAAARGVDEPLVTHGEAMREVHATIDRLAPSDLPILVCGETGVGKEVVARKIHDAGPRRKRTMHCINCGTIPRDLVQSTLFGHERGAFTGASQQQIGLFEEADGSTLLLDEVGELPPEAQVGLLRVLETGKINRVGSRKEISVDVRLISATHRNLESMCEAGTFRWDLFYRINTVTIEVPPLRHRRDEIDHLARHFVEGACRCGDIREKQLAGDVLRVIQRYPWPGNIRELRNAMERGVLISAGHLITVSDLPEKIRAAVDATVLDEAGKIVMRSTDATPSAGHPRVDQSPFKQKVQAYEIKLLRQALERTGWNKTAAAKQLHMPLRTFMHKVQVFGLRRLEPGDNETLPTILAINDEDGRAFKSRVIGFERSLLVKMLRETSWNKASAARRLGLPLSTVLYKLKRFQIEEVH